MLRGVASWYGSVFNGRKTASGETFDMYAMTACHPTLPFGTRVRVIDLANHKSVVVRITDRGDLLNKRIIDLSYAAAEKLEMTKNGLAQVKLEVISLGPFAGAGSNSHFQTPKRMTNRLVGLADFQPFVMLVAYLSDSGRGRYVAKGTPQSGASFFDQLRFGLSRSEYSVAGTAGREPIAQWKRQPRMLRLRSV